MERFETVIIGGGQAGLATGYFLKRRGVSFVILDAHSRVGDSWRVRWDSLRVFSPAKYDGLPGMGFPAPALSFPTKDEVGDYMEAYANRFHLPVRNGTRVEQVTRAGRKLCITTSAGDFEANSVVVATGSFSSAKVPEFAPQLGDQITQLHSSSYKNPAQLRAGDTLVVGLGNSGAEIAMDLLRSGRRVFASGAPSAQVPFKHGAGSALFVLPVIRFMGMHVLTVDSPVGRKVLPKMKGAPLIRVKTRDLEAAGVQRVARVTGVRDGLPLLANGQTLDVANVIWCTGLRADLSFLELPNVFGPNRELVQYRGVATKEPGVYFVGMDRQYSAASEILPGVGRDAAYVARALAGRLDSKVRAMGEDRSIPAHGEVRA